GGHREAYARVGVPDPEGWAWNRLALGRDQLEPSVSSLRKTEDRHRSKAHLELYGEPCARLAVVKLESTQHRPAVGDGDMAWPIVPHQDELLVEVECVELGVGTTRAQPVEDEHGDIGLQIALTRSWNPACSEECVADDQGRNDALVDVVVK